MNKFTAATFALMLMATTQASANEKASQQPEEQAQGKWTFGLGVMGATLPHYPGSDENRGVLLPFPYIHYKSNKLTIDRNGIKRNLWENGNWELTFSGGGSIKVDSKDNKARQGMHDIAWIGSVGPALNYNISEDKDFYLQWTGRKAYAFDDGIKSVGWRGEASINWTSKSRPFMDLGDANIVLKAKLNYATDGYNHYIYGVEQPYTTPTRGRYQGDGGYAGSQLLAGFNLSNEKYRIGLFVRYKNISGAAFEDSPLVRKSGNVAAGFAFAWLFSD